MAEFTLLFGADRGDRQAAFAAARARLEQRVGAIVATSREHWTEPWGFQDDQPFLNRAVLVESNLEPVRVMAELLTIEKELGRERPAAARYAPRTIDLDILFIGERVIDGPELTVPHPRVHERAFALAPAADLVPALVHPLLGRTVLDLLNQALHAA
ncbi:MAG: 2-amino-4-hydroxy-6-hydroxymethyldihydropteridine diphosphokinase [Flavobacteriales bacterium]|nr:2-amino-4-hydroxy-6-hydroxymethyldihydropteridine diphosphokinase [Flavobacteriales bacterium]MEB2342933.1 2-amino-4-hydroxy-6-hydroxymethyldihydropteridine diphosphokinase [Flavobacteriia bacterium]